MSGLGRIVLAAWTGMGSILLTMTNTVVAAEAQSVRLANGFELVVIEDRRAPIVTHFIGYRAGGADDPPGKAGVAHFVEHLMFKSLAGLPGSYASGIARLGGNSNAITTHDATLYHARVPKVGLRLVMQREADRMRNLHITDDDVASEREVILAERRSRIEGRPTARLVERVDMALNAGMPYRRPSIGLAAEIAAIGRADAEAFYRRHYAPDNAFAVVAGDVTIAEVQAIAETTYGAVAVRDPGPAVASDLEDVGPGTGDPVRDVVVRDPRSINATIYRAYRVPGYATAAPGKAEALELLAAILSSGKASRMSKWLDAREPRVVAVDGGYLGARRHGGQISFLAVVEREQDADAVLQRIDSMIGDVAKYGVTHDEFERARGMLEAHHIYRSDDQFTLAQSIAERLAASLTIDQIDHAGAAWAKVRIEDIQAVARDHLIPANAASGRLLPLHPSRSEASNPAMAMEHPQ